MIFEWRRNRKSGPFSKYTPEQNTTEHSFSRIPVVHSLPVVAYITYEQSLWIASGKSINSIERLAVAELSHWRSEGLWWVPVISMKTIVYPSPDIWPRRYLVRYSFYLLFVHSESRITVESLKSERNRLRRRKGWWEVCVCVGNAVWAIYCIEWWAPLSKHCVKGLEISNWHPILPVARRSPRSVCVCESKHPTICTHCVFHVDNVKIISYKKQASLSSGHKRRPERVLQPPTIVHKTKVKSVSVFIVHYLCMCLHYVTLPPYHHFIGPGCAFATVSMSWQ